MPGLDGLSVCRRLRQQQQTRFLPIVLVTALDARQDRIAGIEAGADDFLTKPVDRAQLTARVRALLALKAQRDDSERLRNEFTSMIVHDLRSPLTAIIGFADLLAAELPANQRQEFSTHIIHSARQMLQLINELLDLNRLESGTAVTRRHPVSPAALLADAVALSGPLADGRGLKLQLTVPEDLPIVLGDERKLRQVLTNLLDNAIKFARRTVHIEAAAMQTAAGRQDLRITVTDDGPGVTAAELPQLFDRWHQTQTGRSLGKGSGLGLAIVKRLVEAHGGSITAENVPTGGLTMQITLPCEGVSGGA